MAKNSKRKAGRQLRVQRLGRRQLPTIKEWRTITKAAGTQLPANVLWIINSWKTMADKLQACVQKHELGGAGYNVADIVIEELEKQLAPKCSYCGQQPARGGRRQGSALCQHCYEAE